MNACSAPRHVRVASSIVAMICASALPAVAQTLPAQAAPGTTGGAAGFGRLTVVPTATSEREIAPMSAARLSRSATVNPSLDSSTRQELNLRLWMGSGRTAVGVGMGSTTDPAAPDPAAAQQVKPSSMLFAVQQNVGARTNLMVEHASYAATPLDPARTDLRMGIEFKPVQPLTRMGLSKDSLFRVQLKGTWNLSMRPRSGGVAVAIRADL